MHKRIIIFILGCFCAVQVAMAVDNDVAEQLRSLTSTAVPAQTCGSIAGQVPVIDYLQVWQGQVPKSWFIFKIENALYKLKFYPNLPTGKPNAALKSAIKKFQTSINTKPSGELLVCEWVKLIARVNQLFPHAVYPSQIYPMSYLFVATPGHLEARGTWQMDKQPLEFPFLQTSDIRCFKQAGTCVEANAMIIDDPNIQNEVELDFLTVNSIIWQVERWNDDEIVALNNQYPCLKASLYANLATNKIYKLYRFYPEGKACVQYANKKPHVFSLTDGLSFAQGFYLEQKRSKGAFYNPEYLQRIKSLGIMPLSTEN